jgi:hypothetical protein
LALDGTDGINGTSRFFIIKGTPSVRFFQNMISPLKRAEVSADQTRYGNAEILSDPRTLLFIDKDNSRTPFAAIAASKTFKAKPLIEKIGSVV